MCLKGTVAYASLGMVINLKLISTVNNFGCIQTCLRFGFPQNTLFLCFAYSPSIFFLKNKNNDKNNNKTTNTKQTNKMTRGEWGIKLCYSLSLNLSFSFSSVNLSVDTHIGRIRMVANALFTRC